MTAELRVIQGDVPLRACGSDLLKDYLPWAEEVARRIKPTRRRLNIMSTLATGWMPWGVKDEPDSGKMPLCTNEYIICCGCTMKPKEAAEFVEKGLLQPGEPDRFGRPTLVITEAGRSWLGWHWPR
jgi:hypothetical protein